MAMSVRIRDEPLASGRTAAETPVRRAAAIIPKNSIAGRALIAVVAIMAFLASLTTGAVMLVQAAATDWQSDVAREVTIQVIPGAGRDVEAEVRKAVEIARVFPGVAEARAYTKEESAQLLEPWLGNAFRLDDLPIPRLIVLRVPSGASSTDLAQLRKAIVEQVAGASLDDHRAWIERMQTMAGTAIAGGVGLLMLVFTATVLSVTFATRGAMASNHAIIEVLHFVGAKDSFIARRFQHHFLVLGLKGGAIGGGAAFVLFAIAQLLSSWFAGTAAADEMAVLFGSFSINFPGFLAVLGQIVLIAAVTAATSRHVVNKTLETFE
jgi:cell division transport system permease protein